MGLIIWLLLLGYIQSLVINYLVDFFPAHRKLVRPYCPECQWPVPFLTAYTPRNQCAHCSHEYESFSWGIQISSTLALLIGYLFLPSPLVIWWFCIGPVLIVIAWTDYVYHIITNESLYVLLGLTILYGSINNAGSMLLGIASAILLMGIIYLLSVLYVRMSSVKTDDLDGIGFNDVLLAGILGGLVGFPNILDVLFWSHLILVVPAGISILKRKRRTRSIPGIPLAPYLIIVTFLFLFLQSAPVYTLLSLSLALLIQ